MTHVTCRMTAKNRDQLRNPTLGNRVWATFTLPLRVRSAVQRHQSAERPILRQISQRHVSQDPAKTGHHECSSSTLCPRTWLAETTDPIEVWGMDSGHQATMSRIPQEKGQLGDGASPGPLWSTENIRREPKSFGRWQQRCGLSLCVLQRLVML